MTPNPPRARYGVFVLLRRLRLPLVVLILVYAASILGFTMVPGTDPDGRPWRMSFLHAFYFVSFLGTTIGLGEIPHPFSDAQRLWASVSIYATVVAWLYAVGGLFSVLQDPLFRRIVREGSFEREVRRLREPFFLLCGYDDAGHRVVRELIQDSVDVVIVDLDPARVEYVDVEDLQVAPAALAGDASDPMVLMMAGLQHPMCSGALALTGSDQINTKIALTARMLNPSIPVICAEREKGWHSRMLAAGADDIINPADTFAERVALSIRTPSLHVIYEALTTQLGTAMDDPPRLPAGSWILCGAGQFVAALDQRLAALEIDVTIIEPVAPVQELRSPDAGRVVRGDATDEAVLCEAGLQDAAVLVAGTEVDIDNLAIVLAARAVNPQVVILARQTQRRNGAVFKAAPANLVTLSGYVLAAEVLRRIRAPQLTVFLRQASEQSEAWAADLLTRLRTVVGAEILESWSLRITEKDAPAAVRALRHGERVTIGRLLVRHSERAQGEALPAVPLLVQRGASTVMLPARDADLFEGDVLLLCGTDQARYESRRVVASRALPPQARA